MSAVAEPKLRGRQAATIATVFVGLAVGYPSVFGATSTAFVLPLTREFGWGRLIPSLMFTCAMLGVCVASFFLGRVIERIGAAATAAISSVGLAVALILLSRLEGAVEPAFALAFAAGLLGSGTGVGLYVSTVPASFSRRLGLALGVSVVGQSIGSVLMPWIVISITATAGWRTAYVALGLIHLTVTLIVAAAMRTVARAPVIATGAPLRDGVSPRSAFLSPAFWGLAIVVFLQTLAMFGMTVHLFPIYADRGIAAGSLPNTAFTG